MLTDIEKRNADLDLIWKHTHPDFRGVIDGIRYVLTNRNGATVLAPLHSLPEAELADSLAYARSRVERGLPAYSTT
ncbi:MAG TPA: hypothetical protein VFB89_15560 [Gemmatimonadales bacterium]|nr:hypothetical protein [Gemmatimonadales bacterium]